MAHCADQELMLGALADGELDAANTALTEAHVARCEGCREELGRIEALRRLMKADGVRHVAPASLRRSIEAQPDFTHQRSGTSGSVPAWLAPGAAGAIAASLAIFAMVPTQSQSAIDGQLVSSHVRSLQAGHLMDVQTTNQHIVKPWFNGRIDFAPPVPELAAKGFPLAGGRLDSVDGKTIAAIVYRRRLHVVNLFVWPADQARERSLTRDGFNVTEWSSGGLRFAAVSDVPAEDLRQFEAAFRSEAAR